MTPELPERVEGPSGSERWVNAVIEVVIPLEVSVGATAQEKLDAAEDASERVELPEGIGAAIGWEDVEEGEPLEPDPELKAALHRAEEAGQRVKRLERDMERAAGKLTDPNPINREPAAVASFLRGSVCWDDRTELESWEQEHAKKLAAALADSEEERSSG